LGQMIDHFKDRPGSRSPHPEGEGGKMALFEIEAGQGESVLELAKQYLWGASCQILSDLAGNARLLVIDLS
ncbi:MAG TPA: hypothetical protein VLH85_00840, partial [Levilinea sp.]|nr:hypothetical protein [Levilinea sp.]